MWFFVSGLSKATTAPTTIFPPESEMTPCTKAICEKPGAADITRATAVSAKDLEGNDMGNLLQTENCIGLANTAFPPTEPPPDPPPPEAGPEPERISRNHLPGADDGSGSLF